MAKRVQKKTKSELASPKFHDRSAHQSSVLMASYHVCDKLSKTRRQFILDIANNHWIGRFENIEDDAALKRELRKWDKLRASFLREATIPLELHWFTCNWNADRGSAPLREIVKNNHCDAGTALRLYWINDPYYYRDHLTIGECRHDEERGILRVLRTIERRFKLDNFATRHIPFDPTPWIDGDRSHSSAHEVPITMHGQVVAGSQNRG